MCACKTLTWCQKSKLYKDILRKVPSPPPCSFCSPCSSHSPPVVNQSPSSLVYPFWVYPPFCLIQRIAYCGDSFTHCHFAVHSGNYSTSVHRYLPPLLVLNSCEVLTPLCKCSIVCSVSHMDIWLFPIFCNYNPCYNE